MILECWKKSNNNAKRTTISTPCQLRILTMALDTIKIPNRKCLMRLGSIPPMARILECCIHVFQKLGNLDSSSTQSTSAVTVSVLSPQAAAAAVLTGLSSMNMVSAGVAPSSRIAALKISGSGFCKCKS